MSDSKLRAPLKQLLDDSLDEARVQRMWRGVQRRPPLQTRWLIAAGALAVVAVLMLRAADAGPLTAPGEHALRFDQPRTVLSDGSRIELAAGAQLELLQNNGHSFALRLQRGQARFEVTPGGPRRWRIDCGLASVTVVGTELTIDRGPGTLRVAVAHGTVEVRGQSVPGGVQRLSAGQAVALGGHEAPAPAAVRGVDDPLPSATSPSTGAAAQWLIEADHARQVGDQGRALALLRRLLIEQSGTSEAGIAGLTLARMQMEHDPRAAAQALRASLAVVPVSLREDAIARLVEAYARSGERELAARAAAEYRQSYPGGRRLVEVEHWAAQP